MHWPDFYTQVRNDTQFPSPVRYTIPLIEGAF
jgi:hypothetical protein